ncbi:MAG: hypothetical protein K2J40_06955 [Ruminococcus sp.]|nr:hypothetical protein [Ruminococcus sp.]
MAEVVKCPNCNAQLHIVPNVNVLKCEYCDTEIILNEYIPYSENTITNHGINYPKLRKKWNNSIITADIIQIAISFLFVILMDSGSDIAEGIGILVLFVSAVYSVAVPVHLAHKRPVNPDIKNPSKLSTGLMLYGLFLISFAVTTFITIIITT